MFLSTHFGVVHGSFTVGQELVFAGENQEGRRRQSLFQGHDRRFPEHRGSEHAQGTGNPSAESGQRHPACPCARQEGRFQVQGGQEGGQGQEVVSTPTKGKCQYELPFFGPRRISNDLTNQLI